MGILTPQCGILVAVPPSRILGSMQPFNSCLGLRQLLMSACREPMSSYYSARRKPAGAFSSSPNRPAAARRMAQSPDNVPCSSEGSLPSHGIMSPAPVVWSNPSGRPGGPAVPSAREWPANDLGKSAIPADPCAAPARVSGSCGQR